MKPDDALWGLKPLPTIIDFSRKSALLHKIVMCSFDVCENSNYIHTRKITQHISFDNTRKRKAEFLSAVHKRGHVGLIDREEREVKM